MRRKVLFAINSLAGGGAEHVFATLLAGSAKQAEANEIVVVLLDRDEEAYALPSFVRVHRLDSRHSLARSMIGLWRVVGEEKPDVALSFLTRANVSLAAAMTRRGRPFVLSERVNTTAHLGKSGVAAVSKTMVRVSYSRATRIIAVSQGVADTLTQDFGVAPSRTVAIANPVDVSEIEKGAAATPSLALPGSYVVAMGRLVPNKNFTLAIEAFAASGLPGKLVILGQGPERDALTLAAQRLGLGDRLVMPGFVANPFAVVARAECMLLSSNAEGFPNALVEALACGTPVVATDCLSGPAEILDVRLVPGDTQVEGRGGILVPVNEVAPMAQALASMADPAVRTRLAAAGRRRVADFSVERAVARYWEVIDAAYAER